jgi:hypothetical protein
LQGWRMQQSAQLAMRQQARPIVEHEVRGRVAFCTIASAIQHFCTVPYFHVAHVCAKVAQTLATSMGVEQCDLLLMRCESQGRVDPPPILAREVCHCLTQRKQAVPPARWRNLYVFSILCCIVVLCLASSFSRQVMHRAAPLLEVVRSASKQGGAISTHPYH